VRPGSVWDAAFARYLLFLGQKLDFGGRRVMSNPNEINGGGRVMISANPVLDLQADQSLMRNN
jgi:hypothetical protein